MEMLALKFVTTIVIVAVIYYGVPKLLVLMFGVNYTEHSNKPLKGRFVKPKPTHWLIVQLGGVIKRHIVGDLYVLQRKVLRVPGQKTHSNKLEDILPLAIPRTYSSKDDNGNQLAWHYEAEVGAELDWFVAGLEGWVHAVTGYRVIGASLADLFSAELAHYNLERPGDLRGTTPAGEKDVSYYVELNDQVIPYSVVDADTGGLVNNSNNGVITRSAARADMNGQVTIIIANAMLVFFGVDKYYQNILQAATASLAEAVRGATYDKLRDREWVAVNIDPYPLLQNGAIPHGFPEELYLGDLVKDPGKIPGDSDEIRALKARWETSRGVHGLFEKFGFYITSSSNTQIKFDPDSQRGIDAQQQALLDVSTAQNERLAMLARAEGEAAKTGRELDMLVSGANALKGALGGDAGLAADVLKSQQHSRAAREAKGGAQVWLGGQQSSTAQPVVIAQRGTQDTGQNQN